MYNYVFGKYFFASSHHSLREATQKPFINLVSLSQAYHFITYNRSSTHNDNEVYIINIKVFLTQEITINEMNFNSTNPLGVGNACFEPQVILWDGPSIVDLETNTGLIIQAEAAYYISTRVGNHPNVRGIDTIASHKWY